MVDRVMIVDEPVIISENVHVVIWLNFELHDPVHIPGTITDSPEIRFFRDAANPNAVTGFAIRLINPDEKMRKKAIRFGDSIVDYLSSKTVVPVRSKRPKIERQVGATTTTTTAPQQQPPKFDLDASKLSTLSSPTSIVFKRIHNYQKGLAALSDHDIEVAMAQFHQVIEKEPNLKHKDEYYKPLRHACDHHRIDDPPTAQKIRNFGIDCIKGEPVDFTNVDNWQQLYKHTLAIKQLADGYIKQLLAQSNL